MAPTPWSCQLGNQDITFEFHFLCLLFLTVVVFYFDFVSQLWKSMSTTSSRQRIPVGLATLYMSPSRRPVSRENASPFKLIYIFMTIYPEEALRTLVKPLFRRSPNTCKEFDRVTIVCVEDDASFHIAPVDSPRRQIRGADVGHFPTIPIAKVNSLWVKKAVRVAHHSKMSICTR